MDKSPNNQSFISGIYNYCDRWCERCEFTHRCRVFAKEHESIDDDSDIETVVRKLTGVFGEAKQMLIEKAEELGIDPFAISDEEFADIRRREKAFVDNDELCRLADRYWRLGKEILEDDSTDESLAPVLSVLGWYLLFIPVKVNSSLRGLLDHEGFEDPSPRDDPESYLNGTVKVGLIAIDKSLLAWSQLAETGYADRSKTMIELLQAIREGLEKRFPLARGFLRPGFDEIDVVM